MHTVLAGAFTDSKRDQEKVEQISFEVNGTGKKLLKIIEKERAKMIDRGVLNKVKETKNFTKLVAEKVKVIAEKERCTEVVTEKVRCTEDDFYFEVCIMNDADIMVIVMYVPGSQVWIWIRRCQQSLA